MRIAVFSDVHGNNVAFNAILNDIQKVKVDLNVCLGDAIQGGPQPDQVAVRLREHNCPVVLGNADSFLLTGKETGSEVLTEERRIQLNSVRDWTLSKLSSVDQIFINSFQPTIQISLEASCKLLCFHGSAASFDEVIMPDISSEDLSGILGGLDADVMTGGHTHVQFLRRIGGDARFFFNPGSTGFAYNHQQLNEEFKADPWAEYAILTSEGDKLAVQFRRIPFDVDKLIEAYDSSGRPFADKAIAQYRGK